MSWYEDQVLYAGGSPTFNESLPGWYQQLIASGALYDQPLEGENVTNNLTAQQLQSLINSGQSIGQVTTDDAGLSWLDSPAFGRQQLYQDQQRIEGLGFGDSGEAQFETLPDYRLDIGNPGGTGRDSDGNIRVDANGNVTYANWSDPNAAIRNRNMILAGLAGGAALTAGTAGGVGATQTANSGGLVNGSAALSSGTGAGIGGAEAMTVGAGTAGASTTGAGLLSTAGNWLANNPGLVQAGLGAVGGALDWNAIGRAEAAQNAALDQAQSAITGGYDSARSSLSGGYDTARNDLTGGFNAARGDITTGYNTARGDITGAYHQSRADLEPFRASGVNAQNTLDGLMPQLTESFTGADLYSDPGFLFELDMARKNNYAATAARGLSLSGGAMRELSDYSQGLASTRFNEAFARDMSEKSNVFNMYNTIANRGYGAATTMSNAANAYGANMANLSTGYGNSLAGLSSGYGSAMSNLSSNYGNNLANLAIGQGGNLADIAQQRGAISSAAIMGQNNAITGAIGNGVNSWQQQTMIDLLRQGIGSNNVRSGS